MRIKQLAVGLCAALALGCGHELVLTTGGTTVQRVERSALPDGCRVVGDVSIGIPPDAALARSEDELTILMRNKAADMGADHVVVERSEHRPVEGQPGTWVGSGVAYSCSHAGEHELGSDGESAVTPGSGGETPAETP